MAQTLRLPFAFAHKAILVLTCAASVAACGQGRTNPIAPGTSSTSSTGGSPVYVPQAVVPETQPTAADPNSDGPVNLPAIPAAPTTPVAPSAMIVHATAETVTLPIAPIPGVKIAAVRALLTWTPVKGAVSYDIWQLAAHDGQTDSEKGTKCYGRLPWTTTAVVGAGLGGFGNLAVGQEYDYTIDAIDRVGNIIASGKDNCSPLQPLETPYLKDPGQNALNVGQTPYFTWTPSNGATGYYIEVFSEVGTIPVIPMWRAYRENSDSMTVEYGQQVDVMPGSKPLEWVLPLSTGSRYAWTVCAIRTDTGTLNTCKAIARATTSLNVFVP